MKFTKMHGAGNDYVYVNCFEETVEDPAGTAVKVSDRHFGVGSDGLVLILPDKEADARMRIFNADDSEAAMCGNATRCVAKYIVTRGIAKSPEAKIFNLHTKSGLVRPELLDDGRVCVDMGHPRDFLGSIKLTADCFDFTAETVSMGNPHAVIFVDDIEKIQLEKWGSILEVDKQFPDRCNIEFAQVVTPTQIRMRVWERGCGVTMACGTGSCATLVAAQRTGRVGVEADIILDGGTLHIKHENDGPVLMTGPAQEVFQGEIEL